MKSEKRLNKKIKLNLMFSALVFSSRRRIMLLSNLDREEFVLETDPKFREISLSGGIIGRNN